MVSRRPGHDHIDDQDDIIRLSLSILSYCSITWSHGALVMIILIIRTILSDFILHIIILLITWSNNALVMTLFMIRIYQDIQNIVDMTIETATKMVTMPMITIMMADNDDHLATSSPLMERIWSPGMSLSTLGPPPVTNLKIGGAGGHYCGGTLLCLFLC